MKRSGSRLLAIIVALPLVAAAVPPNPAMAAGALAVALPQDVVADGFSYGTAYNYGSESEARTRALERCRATKSDLRRAMCTVVATFRGQCIAVAMDPDDGTPGVGWSIADTLEAAKRFALEKCTATAGDDRQEACRVEQGAGCDTK
jgi:hypothetical protein